MNKLKKIIKIIIKLLTLGLKGNTNKPKKEKMWKQDKNNYYQYSDTSSEETSSDPTL